MNKRSLIADTDQRSRGAFQKWWKLYWESRDSVPEYSTAIEAWKAACQYKDEQIAELEARAEKDVAVFLFDVTGTAAKPWLEAGYECWIVDIQHPVAYATGGITTEGRLHKVHADLTHPWLPPFDRNRIAFVMAFPPCDHLAVSGARWFKGKGLRLLSSSIAMFATAAEFCEWSGAPYCIENPVSTISSYWRKPNNSFSPEDYTGFCLDDNYTKKTCLWVGGGFVMPEPRKAEGLPEPDDRIHKCPPSTERHNIRSASPLGFCRAAFEANHKLRLKNDESREAG